MNYIRIYDEIIEKFRNLQGLPRTETHHIVPRCLGGNDDPDNLVDSPLRYHFVAHLCLARIYGGKLVAAVYLMSQSGKHTSRAYEWLRRRNLEVLANNRHAAGMTHSRDYREMMVRINSGRNNPFYGRRHTHETREKIRLKVRDVSGNNNPHFGRRHPPETLARIVETRRRNGSYKRTPQMNVKAIETRIRNGGFTRSEESKRKGRETWRRKVANGYRFSDAHRAAMAEAARRRWRLEREKKITAGIAGGQSQ